MQTDGQTDRQASRWARMPKIDVQYDRQMDGLKSQIDRGRKARMQEIGIQSDQ